MAHREEALAFNYDYIMGWEKGNEEGLKGAFDPVIRDKELDADGVAADVLFADADAVTGMASPPVRGRPVRRGHRGSRAGLRRGPRPQPVPGRDVLPLAPPPGWDRPGAHHPRHRAGRRRRSSGWRPSRASGGS